MSHDEEKPRHLRELARPKQAWFLGLAAFCLGSYFQTGVVPPNVLLVGGILSFLITAFWHSLAGKNARMIVVGMASAVSLAATFFWWPGFKRQPEVTLTVINPQLPALVIHNRSTATAQQIKWTAYLANLAQPDSQILPIPATPFDFLTSGGDSVAQSLLDRPKVVPLVKLGDRVVGSAMVECPDCRRSHT
jgi:hypothetical protein